MNFKLDKIQFLKWKIKVKKYWVCNFWELCFWNIFKATVRLLSTTVEKNFVIVRSYLARNRMSTVGMMSKLNTVQTDAVCQSVHLSSLPLWCWRLNLGPCTCWSRALPLSHLLRLFKKFLFWDESMLSCLGWPWACHSPVWALTGMCHHTQLLLSLTVSSWLFFGFEVPKRETLTYQNNLSCLKSSQK